MSRDVSFRRKVIYIAIIALLLYPLFVIGQPTGPDGKGGGLLAQLREEEGLSQAKLGDIDPASESMKLATLGLRGAATLILWEKANEYKKKEDWDKLSATLNQITKLQPNFISVWEFQAHNLSYNISVEFDDYRYRYHWVTKGIDFLIDGIHYNAENPRLLHSVGWFVGQKIGRADEHVQFRELFREDDDFHKVLFDELAAADVPTAEASGYDQRPDNWLVGRLWYHWAEQAVDAGKVLKGKSPLVFHSDSAMSRINYSSTIEEEGILGDVAQLAWRKADADWQAFGRRPIPTSWGHNIRLGDYATVQERLEQLDDRLEELAPGVREQIHQERLDSLTAEERKALETPWDELPEEDYELQFQAETKTIVDQHDVAERAFEENREAAKRVAIQIDEQKALSQRVSHYRSTINYDYWETRCAAEQTANAVRARELLYQAQQYDDRAELEDAQETYEAAWKQWRMVFDQFPSLMDDIAASDLLRGIQRYRRLLESLDKELPPDFPLMDFLKLRIDRDVQTEIMFRQFEEATLGKSSSSESSQTDAETGGDTESSTTDQDAESSDAEMETDKPAADKPAADKPAADEPAADEPAADEPAADEPAADEPPTDKPAADKPPTDKPAADEPPTDKPAANDS